MDLARNEPALSPAEDGQGTDTPAVELRALTRRYKTAAGEVPALRGIDLKIQPGEFVVIAGKSGAGKSTLVNVITGIDRPSSGEVIITGTALHTLNEDQRARWRGLNIGVVFQFFQLLPSINLVKNVTIPMEFCNRYSPKERTARALSLLEQVGIAEHARKTPAEISGGQQQRLAIARALANDPAILVADEPTGNLDSRTTAEILDLFSSLVERGKTLLIVTHDRSIAERAGRQIHIADGLLVEPPEAGARPAHPTPVAGAESSPKALVAPSDHALEASTPWN